MSKGNRCGSIVQCRVEPRRADTAERLKSEYAVVSYSQRVCAVLLGWTVSR